MIGFSLKSLVVGFSFLLAACTPHFVRHPHLIVDADGYPISDDGNRLDPVDFDKRIASIQERVARHIEHAHQQGKAARLLIMIHGGMISRTDGLKYIEEMVDADGFLKGTDLYPIFINWDASLWSSMVDDLFLVRLGNRDPAAGIISSPFFIVARAVNGVVQFPMTLVHHYDTEKMQFEKWDKEHRSFGEVGKNAGLTVVSLPPTLVTLPLISGFGQGAWNTMRRRIDQMFAQQIRPLPPFYLKRDRRPGALRQFFDVIETKYGNDPDKPHPADRPRVEVILAGHSMGTIVANRILREFPRLEYSSIIYMGAAASIDDFITTVPPYLSRFKSTRFYGFSLSNTDESGEFNYFTPRGSLLVWIDNIFEPGLSVTGKRVGFFRNKDAIRIRMGGDHDKACERMRFLKFTSDDLEGVPHKHGDFNDDGTIQRILNLALADAAGDGAALESDFSLHRVCIDPLPATALQ